MLVHSYYTNFYIKIIKKCLNCEILKCRTDLPQIQPLALPSPCQKLVLPSQALIVPCQPLVNNLPLSNNVMPVQNKFNFMDIKFGNNQGTYNIPEIKTYNQYIKH